MRNPIVCCALACLLGAAAAHGATFERAEELYLAGDLDRARTELEDLLATATPDDARALELLGRIAVDREEWSAALEAWGELADDHAMSPQAAAVAAAIRPLRALAGCSVAESVARPGAAAVAEVAPTAPAAPTPPAAPRVADGSLVVGGWGAEYEASQEVAARMIEFLNANGVAVRAASTEAPAIRGQDVVLSYLIEEARQTGASGVLFITTRFNFREFIEVQRFDVNGIRVWREKLVGGTALKERRDRDRPSWGLVDRMQQKLSNRLGTPDLPTGG